MKKINYGSYNTVPTKEMIVKKNEDKYYNELEKTFKSMFLTFARWWAIILCAQETADSPSARKPHFMDLL